MRMAKRIVFSFLRDLNSRRHELAREIPSFQKLGQVLAEVASHRTVKDGSREFPGFAREIALSLTGAGIFTEFDESGAIGRRYRRQDEIGTPYGITVDYRTMEDGTVTVRERDSMAQVRVKRETLPPTLRALIDGRTAFASLGK